MKPRAALHQSAPSAIVRAMSNAVMTLPLAPMLDLARAGSGRPGCCARAAAPSRSGAPTWSVNSSGAAPVPPSPPSTTMKSGRMPVFEHRLGDAEPLPGMADRKLESDRLAARQLAQPGDELEQARAAWRRRCARAGDMQSTPSGTPRVAAISARHLRGGQHAAMAGLGALGKLDLDHLHLCGRGVLGEAFRAETAVARCGSRSSPSRSPRHRSPPLSR